MPYDLISLGPDMDLTRKSRPVNGPDLTLQRVRIRLHTSVGEVLSDAQAGLWTERLLEGRRADQPLLTSRIIQEVEDTPGVIRVVDYTDRFDRQAQRYSITFTALVEDADRPITVTVGQNIPIQPTGPWSIIVED